MNVFRFLVACAMAMQVCAACCADAPAAPPPSASSAAPPKKSCRPEYPAAALAAHAEGVTVIGLTVEASGAIKKVEVLQSAGPTPAHQLLDQAAADALSTCPFKPGIDEHGHPTGTTVKISYYWKMEGPTPAAPPIKQP